MAKLKSLEYKKHLVFQLFARKLAEGKAAQPRYRQTSTLLTIAHLNNPRRMTTGVPEKTCRQRVSALDESLCHLRDCSSWHQKCS